MSENLTTSPEVALAQTTESSSGAPLLEVEGRQPTDEEILDAYEVERVVRFARDCGCKRLALQFPDWMLVHCPAVARLVSDRLPEESIAFVLGDTSYGADCVDEVAAKHLGADGVAHFGPAFSHATSSLPTLFVFGRGDIDPVATADAIASRVGKLDVSLRPGSSDGKKDKQMLVLLADSQYNSVLAATCASLRNHPDIVGDSRVSWDVLSGEQEAEQLVEPSSKAPEAETTTGESYSASGSSEAASRSDEGGDAAAATGHAGKVLQLNLAGASVSLPPWCTDLSQVHLAYIGDPGPGGWAAAGPGSGSTRLTQAMMRLGCGDAIVYSPRKKKVAPGPDIHRQLSRRFMAVEQAKVAKTVGIVVGTLAARRFRDVLWGLKRLVRAAGRGCYTFVIGKLKPEKLANFGEIDVFVLVGAGDSALVDTREFPKPVVLPYEAVLAFNPEVEWDGKIVLDFDELVKFLPPKPEPLSATDTTATATGGLAASAAAEPVVSDSTAPGSAGDSAKGLGAGSSTAGIEDEDEEEDDDKPFFSLVTGKYESRGSAKSGGPTVWGGSTALTVSGAGQVALPSEYTGAGRLAQLNWQGMDYEVTEEADTKVHKGWHGVASGFEGEGDGERGVEGSDHDKSRTAGAAAEPGAASGASGGQAGT